MSDLIDGEVTKKTIKKPPLWRRFLAAYDGQGRWSGLVQWIVAIALIAPAFFWRPWIVFILGWGFGFAIGWWAARKSWLQDGNVPPL
jgi:uncharacterized membrane protein